MLNDLFKLLNDLFNFCVIVVFFSCILLGLYLIFELISDFSVGEIYLVELIGYSFLSIVCIFICAWGLYYWKRYF